MASPFVPASIPGTGGGGSVTQLSDTTLGAPGTFDITGISGGYASLLIYLTLRGSNVATTDAIRIRFNGDTGANYDTQTLNGGAAVATAAEAFAATSGMVSSAAVAASAPANLFDQYQIVILGYASTVWNKQAVSYGMTKIGTASGNLAMRMAASAWRNTAAVNQVTIFGATTANMEAGSRLLMYGVL